MTEQTVKEIIKSFAYGLSAACSSANFSIVSSDVPSLSEISFAEIEQKKAELKEGGWCE